MSKWLTKQWYSYLFTFNGYCPFSEKITAIICRIKGHPASPIWYNYSGFEPNTQCKNCGDEL